MSKRRRVPSWEWTLGAGCLPAASEEAQLRLAEVQARSAFVDFWFRTTAGRLTGDEQAHVVVSFDTTDRLLSFDAWVHERRVYGADDFLG